MSDKYQEYPVVGMEGWVRIVDGKNRRYRTPNGQEISNAEFYKMRKGPIAIPQHAASIRVVEVAPTDDEQEDTGSSQPPPAAPETAPRARPSMRGFLGTRPTPGVSAASAGRTAAGPHVNQQPPTIPHLSAQQHVRETITHLPEAEPHLARRSDIRATPKELVSSFQITLAITTGIVALLLQFPEARMSDFEAMAIAIPAANLFAASSLNEKFGKMLAASGDWQLLGYALWTYGSRVWDATQMRSQGMRQQQVYAPSPAAAPPQPQMHQYQSMPVPAPVQPNGTAQPVNLPFAKGAQGARDLRDLRGA